jgi:PAS domain S-box-containing protein
MRTRKSRPFLYILFGALFVALCIMYIFEYRSLTVNDKETTDQTRVLWMSHHLDKFQLAYNDGLLSAKPILLYKFPASVTEYTRARNEAAAQIDSLKKLCGNVYVPCDNIVQLDLFLQQSVLFSDKVVALSLSGQLDSAAILLNSNQNDSLRLAVREKYNEIATQAREDTQLFHRDVQNEAKRRYVLLGLLITETLLFFAFVLWRMRIQLSDKEINRKKIEKQLQIVNKAIEQSSASVVITNLQGSIEYVNPAFSQLTGYSFEEMIGQNPNVLKSGHTTDSEYKKLWEDITHNKAWQGEFKNKKKNGETYWEYAIISPIINEEGETTNFVAVKENITERKRLEEEQNHLLTIVESSAAYIFTFDLNRNFLYANKAMKDILEVGDGDITKYSITQFRSPRAIAVTPEAEASILEKGKWIGESAYQSLSGKIIPVIQVFILHTDTEGHAAYVSATGIDISKQKIVEDELINLNKELRILSKHLQHVREIEKIRSPKKCMMN